MTDNAGVALATPCARRPAGERAIELSDRRGGGEELPPSRRGWRAGYFELLDPLLARSDRPAEAGRGARRAPAPWPRDRPPWPPRWPIGRAAAVTLDARRSRRARPNTRSPRRRGRKGGARVEAARARTLAGRALADAGERQAGIAELENACGQLDAYGAVRYRREAERELRKLGRPVHRRTRPGKASGAGIETLTEREQEVAGLVVDRHTNPEIAARLFLSVKTVETHMRNILRKLDVSSRADVARFRERGRARGPDDASVSRNPIDVADRGRRDQPEEVAEAVRWSQGRRTTAQPMPGDAPRPRR